MSVYFGTSKISLISKGSTPITAAYRGNQLVYHLGFDAITFTDSGSWVVPPGIKQIRVDCVAAQGFDIYNGHGKGGRVQCILQVSSKSTLYITVGKLRASQGQDVYNASDIRTISDDLNSRLVVAGGGGDHGNGWSYGGNGGGLTGESSPDTYGAIGYGGSQTAGGSPNGTLGYGGLQGGVRGGDGYYGGGGGVLFAVSGVYSYAGGGGGSSYTDPNLCTDVVHTQGFQTGNGYVTISMV